MFAILIHNIAWCLVDGLPQSHETATVAQTIPQEACTKNIEFAYTALVDTTKVMISELHVPQALEDLDFFETN